MRRKLPMAFALLFLFVFVFSMAMATGEDVTARSCKCLGCCVKPPNLDCSAEYGQIYTCGGCSCGNAFVCWPTVCEFRCRVCK